MEEKKQNCENCGSIMEFDIKNRNLKCPSCDNIIEIIKDKNTIAENVLTLEDRERIKVSVKKSSSMECKGCGARVEIAEDCTTVECMYCGSSYVPAENQEEVLIPDAIVPFKIEKSELPEMIKTWMKKRWFVSKKLKNLYELSEIQGMYIPYWTFDSKVECDYTAKGGNDRKVSYKDSKGEVKYKTITDWYNTEGRVYSSFDDILVSALKSESNSLIRDIEPFDMREVLSYSQNYLGGFACESYSVGLEEGYAQARKIIEKSLFDSVRKDVRKTYDTVKNMTISSSFSDETYKYILAPVYSTSYSYNGKTYSLLINGQTGRMKSILIKKEKTKSTNIDIEKGKGDNPKRSKRIILIIIIILIIVTIIKKLGLL